MIFKYYGYQSSDSSVVYDVDLWSTTKTYTVSPNDILSGNAIQKGYTQIVLTPHGYKREIKTNAQSEWNYTIPAKIPEGKYSLTVILQDEFHRVSPPKIYSLSIIR